AIMFYKLCLLILTVQALTELVLLENSEDKVKHNNTTSGCEVPFQSVNNGCYFFSDVQKDFNQAVDYCEALSHGHIYEVTLAMLDYDRYEDQALLNAVADRNQTFWLGGKTDDGLQWYWQDGRDLHLDAPFWDVREPDNIENKCTVAETVTKPFRRSSLYDHDCSDTQHFICQANCPSDFIKLGNYCYLQSWIFELAELSWQDARDYCKTLLVFDGYHADLAVLGLQDQDDYFVINNLMKNHTGYDVWIGAYPDTPCHYQWVDGRELPNESIYWRYDYPKCGDGKSIALEHSSTYEKTYIFDYSSETTLPFICQIFRDN
ncbi:unnamed protein product, partial [Meganyctiphanes norvegica]